MDAYHSIVKFLDIRNAIKLASCNTFWGDVVRSSPHVFPQIVDGDVGNYSFRRIIQAYGPHIESLKLYAGPTCFDHVQQMLDSCPSLKRVHIELGIQKSFISSSGTAVIIPLCFKKATHVRVELTNVEIQFYDMEVLPILEIRGAHLSTLEVNGVFNVHIDHAPNLQTFRTWDVPSVTSESSLAVTCLELVRVSEWDTVLVLSNESPGVSGRRGPLEAPFARHIIIVADGCNPWNPEVDATILDLKETSVETLVLHNADLPPGQYPHLKSLVRDRCVMAYEFEGVEAPNLHTLEIDLNSAEYTHDTHDDDQQDNIRELHERFPSLKHIVWPSSS